MKFIKLYESFEDIDSICEKYGIKNYTINSDGIVDVNGSVNLSGKDLTKLPLKFGKVSGYFNCHNNNLITLEGCPLSLGSSFNCSSNKLTTLKDSPQSVGGYFDCSYNNLISLEGSPQSVLDGYFQCAGNYLTTLEGGPKSVGGYFYCQENELKDLYGFPEFFDRDINYYFNPVSEILDLFEDRLGKVIDLLNEYGVIQQDGKLVILDRLEEVFHILNMEIPEEIKLANYEVY